MTALYNLSLISLWLKLKLVEIWHDDKDYYNDDELIKW